MFGYSWYRINFRVYIQTNSKKKGSQFQTVPVHNFMNKEEIIEKANIYV